MKPFLAVAFFLCLAAGFARAQEYVTAPSKLSDEDFYRLVACAAPPGGACQKPLVRWARSDARKLTLAVVGVDEGYPAKVAREVDDRLLEVLDDLNGSGARLRIRLAPKNAVPDIRIFLLDLPRESPIKGTGLRWFDGVHMQVARMQLSWRDNGSLIECAIAFSRDVRKNEVQSLLTEEIAQCLGLLTDIGGRYYEGRSVFSETGNRQSRLGQQDIMALRRHYP